MQTAVHRLEVLFKLQLAVAMLLIFLVSVPLYGADVEEALHPVFRQMPVKQRVWRESDGALWVDVWVHKRRECEYAGQSYLVGSDAEGWRLVYFSRPGTKPGASRPTGEQTFGLYRFETEQAKAEEFVKGVVRYECHRFWDLTAHLGPWPVGKVRQ